MIGGVRYLTHDEILELHSAAITRYGGMTGLRDAAALESCLCQPQTVVFGHERFADLYEKAAAYCFFLVRLHPFFDGNKRTALLAAMHFLFVNGATPWFDGKLMYEAILGVAQGAVDVLELAAAFENKS